MYACQESGRGPVKTGRFDVSSFVRDIKQCRSTCPERIRPSVRSKAAVVGGEIWQPRRHEFMCRYQPDAQDPITHVCLKLWPRAWACLTVLMAVGVEIWMVCELLGQRAMDKRNRDRSFTDC